MSDKLHIATGGTIDSEWLPEADTAAPAHSSTSAEYLDWMGECGLDPIGHDILYLKDSRETNLRDRDLLAAKIAETRSLRIMGTCGTFLMDAMVHESMNHPMAKFYKDIGKRIVFTGGLTPLKGYEASDGGFNLGMSWAVLGADELPTDDAVLATMNGSVIAGSKIRKELTTATFAGQTGAEDLLGYRRFTLIPAGGTIDFEEDGVDGLVPAVESRIPDYLRNSVRIVKQFDGSQPILKDSRSLTENDMDMVVDVIRASNDEHMLITSGLVKMADFRRHIDRALTGSDRERKVILTGSRYILQKSGKTDAPFNLGFALGAIGFANPGVHVALGGRLLDKRSDPLKIMYNAEQRKVLLERYS